MRSNHVQFAESCCACRLGHCTVTRRRRLDAAPLLPRPGVSNKQPISTCSCSVCEETVLWDARGVWVLYGLGVLCGVGVLFGVWGVGGLGRGDDTGTRSWIGSTGAIWGSNSNCTLTQRRRLDIGCSRTPPRYGSSGPIRQPRSILGSTLTTILCLVGQGVGASACAHERCWHEYPPRQPSRYHRQSTCAEDCAVA
jgi:hypothetical protein